MNLPPRVQKFLDENEDVTIAHVITPDGKVNVVLVPRLWGEENAEIVSSLVEQIISTQKASTEDVPF